MPFRELSPMQPELARAFGSEADPDATFVEAVRRGEVAAFEHLVRRHEQKVFRVARRITRNHEDAEEVAQDTLLQAFKHLGSFRGDSRFSTWLTRIAVNMALMKVRSRKIQVMSLDNGAETGSGQVVREIQDKQPTVEQQCLQQELQFILVEMIGRLGPRYRTVFHLRNMEDLSIAETAEILGLSASVVKSRLMRARLQLRKSLNRRLRRRPIGQLPLSSPRPAETKCR
jgi:RNA polymerase sigma-70 factor (ECF subfamily)